MPVPVPKLDHVDVDLDATPRYPREVEPECHEAVFRTSLGSDGQVVVKQLPPTLDVLLHPREDDQVTQSKGHQRKLNPLADTLERFLERQEDIAVCSDLMILWEKMGARDVAPDVCVFKGVRDRDAIDRSYDPEDQGVLAPCLVIEVVSESTQSMIDKDEEENPELFARMGVADLVWLYPPRSLKTGKLRLAVSRLDRSGPRYRKRLPGPDGWYPLPSVGLRIKLDDDGRRLIIEDIATGERLLTSVEEEAARRAAEERAAREARRAAEGARRAMEEARRATEEARRAAEEAEARQMAEKHAEWEARRAVQAEQHATREAEARRTAEERNVEDLCTVLGVAWSASRKAAVGKMSSSRLEALRIHLIREKSWPEG